jgi:hypothetical protein
MSKRKRLPKVGDTVVLNNAGLEQIWQTAVGLSHMKQLRMKVTAIASVSITDEIPTHLMAVDNEEINQFVIDNNCFDIVDD